MIATGTRLGPYVIVAPLGAGGMGEVYRARDPRLDREVAIKVLPEHFAQDTDRLARFEREAKAVAALAHPNILVLYDIGTDHAVSYAVTELLQGQTLRERLAGSALSWRKTVEIGVALAEGLAAAHDRRITHRDLKPENIFLTADGRVKILDFGLARVEAGFAPAAEREPDRVEDGSSAAPTGPYSPVLTGAGVVMGTVGYMSPEQVRGQGGDARSDIFSFGCVLYEMVTGHRPFRRSTVSETQAAILKEDPPEPGELNKALPAALSQLIMHCLEKNPQERFQAAGDLAFALRAIANQPVGSPLPPGAAPRRQRLPWLLAGLLLLGLAWLSCNFLNRPGRQAAPKETLDRVAVLPFVNVGGDPGTDPYSEGIAGDLISNLSKVKTLNVVPLDTVARYKGKQLPPVDQLRRDLKVEALVMGRLSRQGERVSIRVELIDVRGESERSIWSERYNDSFSELAAINPEISREIATNLRLNLTGEEVKSLTKRQTDDAAAMELYYQGRFYFGKPNRESVLKAIDFFNQAIRRDRKYALAYSGLAESYYWLSNLYSPPSEVLPSAKAAARHAVDLDPELGDAQALLAWFQTVYDWDWEGADKQFKLALSVAPNSATAHRYYGFYLASRGRSLEALAELKQALMLDPGSTFNAAYVAMPMYVIGDYDIALKQCRHAIELDPGSFLPYTLRGLAYEAQGDPGKAIDAYQHAIRMEQDIPVEAKAQLAHVYAVAGYAREARRLLQELITLRKKPHYVSSYNVAVVHWGLGEKDLAFQELNRAVTDRDEWLVYLKRDPRLKGLRKEQRFLHLLQLTHQAP